MRDTENPEMEEQLEPEVAPEQTSGAENAADAEFATPENLQALRAAAAERDELREQALRQRAEFDNYRKRMAREAESLRVRAAESLMRELLPVVDNLERALAHVEDQTTPLAQGMQMVLRQFGSILQSKGLEPIAAVGEKFNPNVHEALAYRPSEEHPAETVVEEYERGYRLGDQVLRPSKVVVSSGPLEEQQEAINT
jgi:molecular chaperone GrpE